MTEDIPQFSEAALAKQAEVDAKEARGEKLEWTDLIGLLEPNPDLPDCQSRDGIDGPKCQRGNHHQGQHRAEVTW